MPDATPSTPPTPPGDADRTTVPETVGTYLRLRGLEPSPRAARRRRREAGAPPAASGEPAAAGAKRRGAKRVPR